MPLQSRGIGHHGSVARRLANRYPSAVYCLFVDLDGVLADFDGGVRRVTGASPADLHPRIMWPHLARQASFYEDLEWLEDARTLWTRVAPLHPTILTGLPRGRWAESQKRAWCRRELGEEVPVITCMSREKARRAQTATPPGATAVLIDDRASLRDDFIAAGGLFIHHTGVESTLRSLAEMDGFVPSLI